MTNKILKSSFHEKLKMFLLVFGVFAMSISQVRADSSVKGANIWYYNGGSSDKSWSANSGSPLNLGTVTNLYLKGFQAYVGDENVCTNTCMYYGFDSGTSLGNYNVENPTNWSVAEKVFENKTGINRNLLTSSGVLPGANVLYSKFIAHGKQGGNDCGDLTSPTYQIKFNYYPDLYVVGNNFSGLGNWDASSAKNKMSYSSDVYSKTISDVSKDNHQIKVSTYNWGASWGYSNYDAENSKNVYSASDASGNLQFQPAMAGNVTVYYTGSTHKIKIICATPTITFDKEGGSDGTDSQNTYYGEATSNIFVPNKSYYDFAGYWDGDDGTGTEVINSTGAWKKNISNFTDNSSTAKWIVRANYTLHAKWTPAKYTITYKDQGGGAYSGSNASSLPNSYTYGTGIATLTAGVKNGYRFDGWFDNPSCTGTAVTSISTTATDAKTFYAKWTANTYKLTFNANGGTITNNGSTYEESGARKINATYNATVSGTMPTARKNGYHFKGWYTASSGGYQVINANGVWQTVANYTDSDKKWKRAENTTLYARYTIGISSLTFTPNSVMPGEDVTVTANFASSENPEGTYSFCYVLTTSDGTELEVQPDEWTQDGLSATFEAPYSAGQYSVEVRLYAEASHDCSSVGSPVASYTSLAQTFTVEATNAVTVQYRCGNIDVRPSTTVQATASRAATVTAPELTGLKFTGWTTSANVSYATGYTSTSNPVQIKASAAGTLTANYSQGPLFFKNTKNWSKVYVYFYKNANYFTTNSSGSEGTGSNTSNTNFISGPHAMSVVSGTTDVYYYNGTIPAYATCVAFTNTEMKNYNYFAGSTTTPCEVVRATSVNANKPMIVPVGNGAIWNQQKAKYYGHDEAPILMDWGYNLRGSFNDWSATKSEFTAPTIGSLTFTTTAYLDAANSTYQWKIYNGDLGYGRSDGQTLTKTSPTSNVLTNYNNQGYNLNVTSNIAGEYTFTLTYGIGTSTSNTNGASVENALLTNMKVTVNFPVVSGDFRLVYTGGSKPHPSNVIKKRANGLDTVNLFVAAGKSNYIKLQPCTATSNSSVTWTALGSCSAPTYQSGVNFATILSEGGPGTYNFIVQQDANGANPKIIKVEKYTGRYYVRTNCVNDDKWNYKLSKDAHTMIYSDYSTTLDKKPYSHYYVKDLHGTAGSPINIRFTVATDYSEAITDSVINGETSGDYKDYYGSESLNRTANVRFSYNQATNKIWRAYTEGPENDNYMLLLSNGTDVFKDNNGSKGAASASIKFADRNNWVYQIDVYANVGAYVKLTAQMHNSSGTAQVQYIKGTSASGFNANTAVQLLSSTTASNEHMRIIYDFKTDRMITAWLPSNTVTTNIDIDADVLLIRKHQEAGQSITISSGKKLSSIQTVYGVMQFDKDFLNDVSKSKYTRDLFWISFPFDVKLSDVFGFGTYGQHWIIEYYDGIERAQKGYWIDSPGFWKFVMPEERDDYILKANQGYVLALDLDELGTSASVWNNSVTTIYLYFPSSSTIGDLENMSSVTVDVPQDGYQCTIDRTGLNGAGTDINKNRTVADSYWHIIGAASYADAGRTDLGTSMPTITITNSVPYVYKWNSTTNLYQVHSTKNLTFDAMRGYMVQYNGANITWSNVSGHKTSVARRAEAEDEHFAEFKVALMQGEESLDHTFVRLSDEDEVTENFEFGHDMCKEFNGGKANIYSIVENYIPTAGNSLPMSLTQTTLVPLGVRIVTEGEYIFSIPEGTSGVGVSLIDNETGTRTNLGLTDYAVTLPAGDHNNRFVLEISPIVQVTTSVEQINGENSDAALNGVCKKLIDGVLYIIKDGKVFDARGARLQ